jgi:endoribonuclease LACTB2
MNIVNVGYDSTNYYLLEPGRAGLLVDVGWPGTMPRLLSVLKQKSVPFSAIQYLLITHFHPDHAGLAQEMKNMGCKLIVIDTQVPFIGPLAQYMKPAHHYQEIGLKDNNCLKISETRQFLGGMGIQAEIIATPGHSDDSITLILDDGAAFSGDLPRWGWDTEGPGGQVEQSWNLIRAHGVKTIYPGHGPAQVLE